MIKLQAQLMRLGLHEHPDSTMWSSLLEQAPQSELLITHISRLLERDGPLFVTQPDLIGLTIRLAMQGDYPRRMLEQDPYLLAHLAEHHAVAAPLTQEQLEPQLRIDMQLAMREAAASDVGPRAAIMEALRVFKRRVSLTIYAREIQGVYSVRETSAAIAALATTSLRLALEHAAELHDDPALADEVCVFGMGKLGGQELNYSSDVDLIFVCSEALGKSAERHQSAIQMMRTMVALIDEPTAQGYVFRVDLRLRPEGAQGALLPSAPSLVNYYMSCGRTWERSAMLKARAIAGNIVLGERVLADLDSFIYKRYLDFTAIDELREMKALVNAHARGAGVSGKTTQAPLDQVQPASPGRLRPRRPHRPGSGRTTSARRQLRRARAMKSMQSDHAAESQSHTSAHTEPASHSPQGSPGLLEWDVKIGEGGIREIEFFVQALQLVHCGTRPSLRVCGTLDTLDRLLYVGLVPHEDYTTLTDAYDFYRRVEHRVQMELDRQEHALPASPEALDGLARRMEFEPEHFRSLLKAHRRAISEIFARLFTQSEQVARKPTLKPAALDALEDVLFDASMSPQRVVEELERAGFSRPLQVAGQLQMLAQKAHGPFARGTSKRGAGRELGAYLIRTSAAAPMPEQAIGFISRLVSQVGDRAWFWQMLQDNPHATRLLVHVFGSSELLGQILLRDPNVVYRLLGAGSVAVEQTLTQMSEELADLLKRIEDPAHRMGVIHRFQQEHLLRLGLHEIGGAASTQATVRQLGELAEVTLGAVLQEVWANLRQSKKLYDAPKQSESLPFSVVAMGKFGGIELGFGSDLDLIFVCEPDDAIGLDLDCAAKLAQRLVRALSALSAQGRFYEVDTRLRPSGRQGTLVVTCEALRAYHETQASVWERQALCRARAVSGQSSLREAIGQMRHELVFERALPAMLVESMGEMRGRMIQELTGESRVRYDIKKSRGGLIDLEYMTQYLQFWLAARHRLSTPTTEMLRGERCDEETRSQNTHEALCALGEHGLIQRHFEGLDVPQLARDYMVLRRVELRLKLGAQSREAVVPDEPEARAELARTLGFQGEEALAQLRHLLDTLRDRVIDQTDLIFAIPPR